jgi:hypothetical protein
MKTPLSLHTRRPGHAVLRDLCAALFIVAFLLPNLLGLIVPYEEFPYTSVPMFAHYVGDDTGRYRFRFVVQTGADREERELRATELGLGGLEFSRYFFSFYGSIEPFSPFSHHRGDTREAFEARLSGFFGKVVTELKRRDREAWRSLSRIRLEIARLGHTNHDAQSHVVGHYDVASGRFIHTWGR